MMINTDYTGKTVAKILVQSQEVVFLFTDNSTLKLQAGLERWDAVAEMRFDVEVDDYEKKSLGIMTQEEYDEIQKKQKEERDKKEYERKLAEFERLKRQLGK